MKSFGLFLLLLLLLVSVVHAQDSEPSRSGVIFGTAIGVSSTSLTRSSGTPDRAVSPSLPNIKLGYMLSGRSAVVLYLPGSLYKFRESGRARDRGFEAISATWQTWLIDRVWVSGGIGMGLDAPAFYDIREESERVFNVGFAAIAAAGFEFRQTSRTAIDLQARIHYGTINTRPGNLDGLAISVLVGFNVF